MKNQMLAMTLSLLAIRFFPGVFLMVSAQPSIEKSTPPKSPKSLQQQIDALRESQERMLQGLEEIKALLKEVKERDRSARVEAPALVNSVTVPQVNIFGEPFKGDSHARVAILEYSDFDCSFCANYATNVFPRIDTEYVKTGKIKYFFRDLPMPDHTNAVFRARIARCAGDQNKFWQVHDYLFAHQGAMAGSDLAIMVKSMGLDAAVFSECLTGEKYMENIRRSVMSAERLQIKGTPAFVIGTIGEDGGFLKVEKVMTGTQSYEFFKSVLDQLVRTVESK